MVKKQNRFLWQDKAIGYYLREALKTIRKKHPIVLFPTLFYPTVTFCKKALLKVGSSCIKRLFFDKKIACLNAIGDEKVIIFLRKTKQ